MSEPADLIEIRGIRALGRHGVLEEEKARPQPFEVDLDLELDVSRAGWTDALADTVDYGAIAAAVAAVIEGEHSDLLEHLATRIARAALLAADGAATGRATGPMAGPGTGRATGPVVTAVSVTLRKLRPPVPVHLTSAGVRIHRRRQQLD